MSDDKSLERPISGSNTLQTHNEQAKLTGRQVLGLTTGHSRLILVTLQSSSNKRPDHEYSNDPDYTLLVIRNR